MKYFHKFRDFSCAKPTCGKIYKNFKSYRRHYVNRHLGKNSVTVRNGPTLPEIASNDSCLQLSVEENEDPCSGGNVKLEGVATITPLTTGLARFFAGLYSSPQVPLSVANTISSDLAQLLQTCLKPVWERYDEVLGQALNEMSTNHTRMKYFESIGTYIKPERHVVGSRQEFTRREGGTLKITESVAYTIPMRKLLKSFLSLEDVLQQSLEHVRKLESSHSYMLSHFIEGSFWKSQREQHCGKMVWPLFLQCDDYESLNCLGSHSSVYKIGACYVSLPFLPDIWKSRLSSIFLTLLYFSSDRVQFGNQVMFQPLIDEFNFLFEHGIEFNTPQFQGTIYFQLALILGDNLGINSITGFSESFSCNFPCRMCKVHKNVMSTQVKLDRSLLRTMENYFEDLAEGDCSLTGIKSRSVWLGVSNFDLFNQIGVDVMHDIHLGVMKYVMAKLIVTLIDKEKFFTLHELNFKIANFDLGPDSNNRPVALTLENLRKGEVRLSSAEISTLFRYFGVMLGHYVPRGNKYWSIYITLNRILDVVMNSQGVTPGEIARMKNYTEELCELYMSLFNQKLKPKFHFLLHYQAATEKYGPLRALSSTRFEAKHRLGKLASKTTCNRINVAYTIANRHQLMLNNIFIQGRLPSHIEISPSRKRPITNAQLTQIFNDFDNVLEVHWIKVGTAMYRKGSVLIHYIRDDELAFIEIDKCYIEDGTQKIAFTAYPLHTDYFDDHYYAYSVRFPTYQIPPILVEYTDLLSPFPCNTTFVTYRGVSNSYVVLCKPV